MLNEASRLPGLTVYTRNGQRLGVVHDVLLDTTQRIISALLITGTTPQLVKDGENIIEGAEAFLLVWKKIPKYKFLYNFFKTPIIFTLFSFFYEIIAFFLFLKNKKQLLK